MSYANGHDTARFIKVGASGTLLMAAGPILLTACQAVAKTTGSSQLRVGTLLDLDSLNPFVTTTSGETHGLVYDRLMVYDAQLKPALSLATKRSASADGTQITWTLQHGATSTMERLSRRRTSNLAIS